MTLDLDSVLNGAVPSKPLTAHESRDLYGPTPFIPRAEPVVIALTIEQHCKHCGHSWLSFGGLFREFIGSALQSPATYRNALKEAPKHEIARLQTLHEDVPYCPHCLGTGDMGSGVAALDKGGGVELAKPLSTY